MRRGEHPDPDSKSIIFVVLVGHRVHVPVNRRALAVRSAASRAYGSGAAAATVIPDAAHARHVAHPEAWLPGVRVADAAAALYHLVYLEL